VNDRVQLPLRFDAAALQADVRRLEQGAWIRHFVKDNYEGDWTVLPLRASASAVHPVQMIYSDPSCAEYVDTPLLAACPAIRSALAAFECPLESVRLMRLGAGSIIKTHTDHDLDVEHGRARLHVPIDTNPGVDFRLNGERVVLNEGECWYLRLSDPHSVANRGDRDRIHLVIDAIVSPWLLERLEAAEAGSGKPEAGSGKPEAGSGKPEAGSRKLEAGSGKPEAGSRKLEAGSGKLEAGSRKLEAGSRKLEAGSGKPEAGSGKRTAVTAQPALPAWIPARVRAGERIVEWCELGNTPPKDPFFEDTIARAKRTSGVRETPFDVLLAEAAAHPGLVPTAFIFHGSRCGSTLVSQLARALPETVVIAEAPAIDDVLRSGWPGEARVEGLRAVVAALGQPRAAGDRHLVIKFDAWHVIDVPLVRDAFPGVPCVFVYRNPADVIASQMRMPGGYLLPGALDPAFAGLASVEDVSAAGREGYCARVQARILTAAAELAATGLVDLLNYEQFPGAAIDRVLAWTGRQGSADDRRRLTEAAAIDAKTPGMPFAATRDRSHQPSAAAREAAAAFADRPFAALERLRTSRG